MHRNRSPRAVCTAWIIALALAPVSLAAERAGRGDGPPLERVQVIALNGPIGGLDHLALDARRGRLFVANTANGSLDVVDLRAGRLLKQVPGQGRIRGVAYSPEADRIFVGNGDGGVCNIFDGSSYALIRNVPLGDDADNVRYNPRTHRIYVVHADSELSVIDAGDFTVRSPIALSKDLGGFQLESSRPRMYLNAKGDGVVVVIELDQDRVIGRFPVAPAGLNAAVAIDEPNHRLYVGCRRNPSVVVMNSDSGAVVDRIPIPGDVDDISLDAPRRRIYASCGEGAIAVIRRLGADRHEALAAIPTVEGARTSVFDAEGGRLYLAVPRRASRPQQEHPEVWVYRVRP